MKRIIIGGTGSGCGKTTVTCAVLQALCSRGLRVSSFKCGPDYIDPAFHEKIIGASAYNLDSFFCDDSTLCYLLNENSRGSDIAVIEGAMGFYDGADGRGSAHSVSSITNTAAVVVIDCKGMSNSIGAVMKGFLEYRGNNIVGFIFNRLPEKLVPLAKTLCAELKTEYLGFLPRNEITLESRHLGLVTADETAGLKEKMQLLGRLAEKYILLDRMIETADRELPQFTPPQIAQTDHSRAPVISVARDRAFCFIYKDNISLLEKLGCEIVYFSPLTDKALPKADGLILCGGYPELYLRELSENKEMLSAIQSAIKSGIPTIAECGGFMYLHDSVEDSCGTKYKTVGVISGNAYKTEKLRRFGYITMTADRDNLLCKKGESFPAHEFHYWDSTSCGDGFTARKPDGREWKCGHISENMYLGFPHLYLFSRIGMAENFVKRCAEYGGLNGKSK